MRLHYSHKILFGYETSLFCTKQLQNSHEIFWGAINLYIPVLIGDPTQIIILLKTLHKMKIHLLENIIYVFLKVSLPSVYKVHLTRSPSSFLLWRCHFPNSHVKKWMQSCCYFLFETFQSETQSHQASLPLCCLSQMDSWPPLPPRPYTLEDGHQQLYLRNSSRKNYYHHFLFLHFTFRILGKIGMVPFEVMAILLLDDLSPWIKLNQAVSSVIQRRERKTSRQLNLTAQSPIKHQSFLS